MLLLLFLQEKYIQIFLKSFIFNYNNILKDISNYNYCYKIIINSHNQPEVLIIMKDNLKTHSSPILTNNEIS